MVRVQVPLDKSGQPSWADLFFRIPISRCTVYHKTGHLSSKLCPMEFFFMMRNRFQPTGPVIAVIYAPDGFSFPLSPLVLS